MVFPFIKELEILPKSEETEKPLTDRLRKCEDTQKYVGTIDTFLNLSSITSYILDLSHSSYSKYNRNNHIQEVMSKILEHTPVPVTTINHFIFTLISAIESVFL